MKYVVAVSGGVDSMALLHILLQSGEHELVVAHFDHGIRPDSHLDAELVERAARQSGLQFEMRREELGPSASEELARSRRYEFLREVARRHEALLITAHHLDDLVETIAINVHRGTGWRGLAVLDSDVERPLVGMDKQAIIDYAKKNNIEWRNDSTNESDAYLRNRIRKKLEGAPEHVKREFHALQVQQKAIRRAISQEVSALIGSGPEYSRYLLTNMPASAALECLHAITGATLTRPQLARLLNAVKVAKPGSTYEAGNGVNVHFSTRHFSL